LYFFSIRTKSKKKIKKKSIGKSACHIKSETQAKTYKVGEIGEHDVCVSLESSCMHPDLQYYQDNPSSFSNPWETYCAGGGENTQRAKDNILGCIATLKNTSYTESCPNNGNIKKSIERNAVVVYYTPCPKYIGRVDIGCTVIRSSDDYSGGGPNTLVSSGTFSFQYDPISCVSCLNGECDDVMGCICFEGFSGENCSTPNPPSSFSFS